MGRGKNTRLLVLGTLLSLSLLVVACGGPRPYGEHNKPTVIKADTVFFQDGSWFTGKDIYSVQSKPQNTIVKPLSILVSVLLAILFFGGILLLIRRSKMRELQHRLADAKSVILHQETLLSSRTGSALVLKLLRDKIGMVKQLIEKHDAMKLRSDLSYVDELESLQEAVKGYQAFLEELRGDTSFLGEMEDALNEAAGGIMNCARQLLKDQVSEDDYQILACIFAGMDAGSISFVTGISRGTVRTKKSRIKARIANLQESEAKNRLLSALNNAV